MRATLFLFAALLGAASLTLPAASDEKGNSEKGDTERKDAGKGWKPLFDGKSLSGWRRLDGKPIRGWTAEDGTLRRESGGGDIYTEKEYSDFILELEWKINQGGNSGVKYRMTRYDGSYLGPEFQVLGDADAKVAPNRTKYATGALYDLVPVDMSKRKVLPAGQWNRLRIVANGSKIEHWLNGEKVMAVDVSSKEFHQAVAGSKFRRWTHYAQNPRGRIMLQEHGGNVVFRKIRIRELPAKKSR